MEDIRDDAGGGGAGFRIFWISILLCFARRCVFLPTSCGRGQTSIAVLCDERMGRAASGG